MTTNYAKILEDAADLWHCLPQVIPDSIADIPENLRLFDDGKISVVYAPFSHINHSAKLAIVGITPGWYQTRIGFEFVANNQHLAKEVAEQEIKNRAAFAGIMRTNLVEMLDSLRLNKFLEISTTDDLFGLRFDLLHSTSALRHSVFKKGLNYSGHGPNPLDHPFLRFMVENILAPELASVPDALVIPLGKAAEGMLEHLSKQQLLPPERLLWGFPHPSGANGHRKRAFELMKQSMENQINHWFKAT